MSAPGGRQEVSGDELRLLAERAAQVASEVAALRAQVQSDVDGVDGRGWNTAAFEDLWQRTRFGLMGLNQAIADANVELLQRSTEADELNSRIFASPLIMDDDLVAEAAVGGTSTSIGTPSVSSWSAGQKIEAALLRALSKLPAALADQLRAVLTPENIAVMVGVLAVWAASQAVGVGEVVDLILAVGGAIMLGPQAIRAVGDLAAFATGAIGATSDADLDAAGGHLADAIAIVGVDGAMALLAHKGGATFGESVPRIGAADVEVMTPEGVQLTLRVPETGTSGVRAYGASEGFDAVDPQAEALYNSIRGMDRDVAAIARNTGAPEDVVATVKQHLFMDEHDIAVGPNQIVRQRFDALPGIGDLWMKAANGELSADDAAAFDRLLAHEHMEANLMQTQNLPYRSADPSAWQDGVYFPNPDAYGAHDLAPRDNPESPWGHYTLLGQPQPNTPAIPWREDPGP